MSAFPAQKIVQPLVSCLAKFARYNQNVKSLKHSVNDSVEINPSKEWTRNLKEPHRPNDKTSIATFVTSGWSFHSALAYPMVNYPVGGLDVRFPVYKDIILTAGSIESRPLVIAIDNAKENEVWILCRGTDFNRKSELLISLGLESRITEFNNNETVSLDTILKVGPGIPTPAGRGKKAFWDGFMTSTISHKDDQGNVSVLVRPMWQSLNDFVAGLPKGRKIKIVTHSMGTAVGTGVNLAIAMNASLKPQSVLTVNCGGLNTLDAQAVEWFEKVCRYPIFNLACTTDCITQLDNIWTAMVVGTTSEQSYSNAVKSRLKQLIYKPTGMTTLFVMKFGFGGFSPLISHSLNTYELAVQPNNYGFLYKLGEKPKGACTALTEDQQKSILEEALLARKGFQYSDQYPGAKL